MRKQIAEYDNGNVHVIRFSDGTVIRFSEDDEFNFAFPENMDVKITDRCTGTNCSWCHEGSGPRGKHGDILNAEWVDSLRPFTEVACLTGDTYVYNNNGAIRIDDLKIGDRIYDSDYKLRKVTRITQIEKETINIKGQRGLNIYASVDHPFISNNEQISAIDLMDKPIDKLQIDNKNYPRKINTIDLKPYIHKPDRQKMFSRGGHVDSSTAITLVIAGHTIPRYININKDIMYLYGWFVAEGSRKGLTLNINEENIAKKLEKIWENTFNLPSHIYKNPEKSSLNIELSDESVIDAFFIKALKVGEGARNKSLSYLFSIDNIDFIRSALLGLYEGDGCFRTRLYKGKENYCASLKTTSRRMAYETAFLMARWFGVYPSIYHGISPKRKIENRTLQSSDYYSVEIYGLEDLKAVFPSVYEKYTIENCNHSRKMDKVKTISEVGKNTLYDITLDSGTHIFPINGFWLTHNCGGGNALEHPDLLPFLIKLKEKKVFANLTVNQMHFLQNQDKLLIWSAEGLIHGLGVSLVKPTEELFEALKKFPNAVIHVIAGILTEGQIKELMEHGQDIKLLILGYKDIRRGAEYHVQDYKRWIGNNHSGDSIDHKIMVLESKLLKMFNAIKVVSFDCLAIEQLHIKDHLPPQVWDRFYQGEDGTMTFYIDMVNQQFAESSTAPFEDRMSIGNLTVDGMFQTIKEKHNADTI